MHVEEILQWSLWISCKLTVNRFINCIGIADATVKANFRSFTVDINIVGIIEFQAPLSHALYYSKFYSEITSSYTLLNSYRDWLFDLSLFFFFLAFFMFSVLFLDLNKPPIYYLIPHHWISIWVLPFTWVWLHGSFWNYMVCFSLLCF